MSKDFSCYTLDLMSLMENVNDTKDVKSLFLVPHRMPLTYPQEFQSVQPYILSINASFLSRNTTLQNLRLNQINQGIFCSASLVHCSSFSCIHDFHFLSKMFSPHLLIFFSILNGCIVWRNTEIWINSYFFRDLCSTVF